LDDDDELIGKAVIPEDESPEDARLRREMLQYNLNEVGQVVAELDLDENLSEFEDDDDYFDDDYDSEMSEEEDEHGRSIRPGVSKSYRDQMKELDKQLRSRIIGNLGPNLEEVDPVYDPEGLRRLVVRGEEGASDENVKPAISKGKEAVKSDASAKKGVRFSEELDVQKAPKTEAPVVSKPRTAPIADVVERAPSKAQAPSQPTKPAKASRFKQSRAAAVDETAQPESAPQDSGSVMSDKIVEHPAAPATNARAPEEVDELDPELQQRQLASEYYRLRNNIIRQQGGFKETEEEADDPLMEQFPDGKMKKVSRFKAARMKF
jgi:unconventional prefoldin RPB5 interactor 1